MGYTVDEHGDSLISHIHDVAAVEGEEENDELILNVYVTADHEVEVWVGEAPHASMFTLTAVGSTLLGHALLDASAEAERLGSGG